MATLVNTYAANSGEFPTGTGSALTTAAFTPANGEILVVKLSTWVNSIAMTAPTGGSQTFVQRVRHLPPSDGYCFVAIYTAVVSGSPTNMTVTSTNASGTVIKSMVVERWSQATLAVTPVTVRQSYSSPGAPNINFTTTAANSKISLLCAEYLGVDGTATYRGTSTETSAFRVSGSFNGFHWYQSVATASTVAVGMTSPSGQQWNIAGIELLNSDSDIEQPVGLISGVDSANTLSRRKSRTLSTVIDTHGVWQLGRRKSYEIGLQELASALSLGKSKTKGIGNVHGSDSALVQGRLKSRVLGVEGETSLVTELARSKVKGIELVHESDSPHELNKVKALSVGFVSESALVNELSRSKSHELIMVTDVGLPWGIGRHKERSVGLAESADGIHGLGSAKGRILGLPGGSQTVHSLSRVKALILGLVSQTDSVSTLNSEKSRLLGLVHEIDRVFSFGGELGLVHETSTVHSLGSHKARTLGAAGETGLAQGLGKSKVLALGLAESTDVLGTLGRIKSLVIGELLETNSLELLEKRKAKLLGLLESLDSASPLVTSQEFVDRSGPLTDSAGMRMSTANRYSRR